MNGDFEDVFKAVSVLDGYKLTWADCVCRAIDLFLNKITRPHKDVDCAVFRRDQLVLQKHLLSRDWTLEKAVKGQLIAWEANEWIDLPVHVIRCKNSRTVPDFIEFLIVLLYKSVKPENDLSAMEDFRNTVPMLSPEACDWLAAVLRKMDSHHIWLGKLS